jgi:hypothetical protein
MRFKIIVLVTICTLSSCKKQSLFTAAQPIYRVYQDEDYSPVDLSASNDVASQLKYAHPNSNVLIPDYILEDRKVINENERNTVQDTSRKITNEDRFFSQRPKKPEETRVPKQTILSIVFGSAALIALPLIGMSIPLSLPFGVLALIFGLIGLKYIIKNKNKGLKLSIIGMCLGVLSLIVSAILILVVWTSIYKL